MKVSIETNPPDATTISLITDDEYCIGARLFKCHAAPRARIIVAGATGVPQTFYQAFAQFAASQGYETLTLDYRGIGFSKPKTLRGFTMNYLDWAHLDLASAVEFMHSESTPLYMVGHSFGGHAFGLLPNHHKVAKFYTYATGAGWHGWMPKSEQIKVLLMWKIIGPLLVSWKGYLAWSKLGMGADLPKGVFRDWKHWCQFPHYFFDDPAMLAVKDKFGSVKTPIMAANAIDDLWAMPRSRDAFMSGYPKGSWQGIDINPADFGLKSIGHMGYFRRQALPLWRNVLDWLEEAPKA